MSPPTCCKVTSEQPNRSARAAAKFVNCAERFEADIFVTRQGVEVPGRSIMGLMMLAAAPDTEIEVRAVGVDAAEAVAALEALIAGKFDEDQNEDQNGG